MFFDNLAFQNNILRMEQPQYFQILMIGKQQLQNMNKKKVVSILKNAISLVKNFDPRQTLQSQCQKHSLLKSLNVTTEELQLQPTANKHAIGIRNLLENPNLRLTIYYLEEGTVMKLHDHKQMHVVSKIISGKIEAKLYRATDKEKKLYEKKIVTLEDGEVIFIDGEKTFDLHEFKALEPTFFLDIIFPDYSEENDCDFYEEQEEIQKNVFKLKKVPNVEIAFEEI